jgi:hypothetical protein
MVLLCHKSDAKKSLHQVTQAALVPVIPFRKKAERIMPVPENLDGFLKNCIIAFHILYPVPDPVYGHNIQKRKNADQHFSLENIGAGQEDSLEFRITNHDHRIHQGILVIWGEYDGLINWNVMKIDHADLPVIYPETKFYISLE